MACARAADRYCRRMTESEDLKALRAELRALLATWEYAFAMGHGCSLGGHPRHRAMRERVADLRSRIAEHVVQ